VDSEILPNDTPSYKLSDADGIVLSGGAPSIVSELNKLGYVKEYLAEHDFPVLGICVGAQFIALNSGGEVGPGTHPEYGKTTVRFFNKGAIFSQGMSLFPALLPIIGVGLVLTMMGLIFLLGGFTFFRHSIKQESPPDSLSIKQHLAISIEPNRNES